MDLQSLVTKIEIYVLDLLPCYIEELRQLCAIDSGSSYKEGLDETAKYLAKHMSDIGMIVSTIQNDRWGCDVVGTLRGDGSGKVTLLCHLDTVYPTGTASARPMCREGNVLYAPGVSDMKGCILSALYAVKALIAMGSHNFGEINLLCVSDEEISQRHSVDLITTMCQDCNAVLVLEAARANGNIVSSRKGTAWYTLTARGHSAHAGVEPEKGRNAIVELAHQILQFYSLQGYFEGLSICPGVVSGGTTPNVIPDYAQARFDLRFLQSAHREYIEKCWGEMLRRSYIDGVELTLALEAYRDPMPCTAETIQLVHQAQEIAHFLGFSLDHELSGGTSDGRYAATLQVPVLDGLGPIGGLDHSPKEYLMADSIAPRTALLAGLIASVSG